MGERIGQRDEITPQPTDWRLLIAQVQAGDQVAWSQFYNQISPIFHGYLGRYPNIAHDVIGLTEQNIATGIASFAFSSPVPDQNVSTKQREPRVYTDEQWVKSWVQGITRNALVDIYRKDRRQQRTERRAQDPYPLSSPEQPQHMFAELLELAPTVRDTLNDLLVTHHISQRDWDMTMMRDQYSPEKVGAHYGIDQKSVARIIKPVRELVEAHILTPLGMRRLTIYPVDERQRLEEAQLRRRLEILTFAGKAYTSENWVEAYRPYQVTINGKLLEAGYVPVHALPERVRQVIYHLRMVDDPRIREDHRLLYMRKEDVANICEQKGIDFSVEEVGSPRYRVRYH